MSKNYESKKLAELGALCKKIGTKHTGTKDDLINRLKCFDTCEERGLKAWNGQNPALITIPSQMNIANAKCGLGTMLDTWDQLLMQLVKHLQANTPSASSGGSSSGSSSSSSSDSKSEASSEDAGIKVAKRIMELDEVDDWLGMLNLATFPGTPPITATSSTATMRKNYLKLSLLIHPDKLGRVFSDATKAFQALVRAFERLSSPSYAAEAEQKSGRGSGKDKVATIARSNEGCHRTRVCCPRCKQAWSEGGLDGNPDYFYNFIMMGLKQFTCSTCLFHFGCMTAIHKCPHCSSGFEYSPADYHRKLTCSREKCTRPFGFMMYKASDKVLSDLKNEVRLEVEAHMRAKEAKIRRAARAGERGSAGPLSRKEEIKAYLLGLADACPLCGLELDDIGEEAQREHLRECRGDKAAHAAYSKKKEEVKAKADVKEKKKDLQQSVQSEAVFSFLGAKPEQLWILDDQALQRQAKLQDLDASGSRDDLISRLASSSSSSSGGMLAITEGGRSTGQQRRISTESLPRNYQSLSLAQLRSVLAAHGHRLAEDLSRQDVLDFIEAELHGDKPPEVKMMIEDGKGKKQPASDSAGGLKKRSKVIVIDDDDDDDDFELED